MTPEELRANWHQWLLVAWKDGKYNVAAVVKYYGTFFPEHTFNTWQEVVAWLSANGVTTLPPLANEQVPFMPIGAWMFAAWPQLSEVISKVKDARQIDLSALKFIPNPKLKDPQTRYIKRKTMQNIQEAGASAAARHHFNSGKFNKLRR